MKKKGLVVLATAMVMAFGLAACGGSDSGKDNGGETTAAASEDAGASAADVSEYSFKSGSTEIKLGVPAADIVAALGEPQDKYEAESCAFQGMDRTYTYPGYTLDTYEENGVETTLYVTFKDDTVSTNEGLSIGDDVAKAKELYGEGEDNGNSIVFTKGDTNITAFYEDGTIKEIQYTYTKAQPKAQ